MRNVLVGVVLVASASLVQSPANRSAGQSPANFTTIRLDQLHWIKNADLSGRLNATIFGDRAKAEPFGYVVKWPPHATAPAHTHPEMRHAVVLKGTFYHAFGTKFDPNKVEARPQGTFFDEPLGEAHFGLTKDEEVILYFVGVGPDRMDIIER
jgi:quercetin dioxygenase-like cupin family protein